MYMQPRRSKLYVYFTNPDHRINYKKLPNKVQSFFFVSDNLNFLPFSGADVINPAQNFIYNYAFTAKTKPFLPYSDRLGS